MIRKLILILILVIAVFLGIAALQPATFSVSRSATMAAPPAAVFAQVNDLHRWEAWSPWAKRDPQMKVTYEGPATGAGASYTWAGNQEVGEGRMTITESTPDERIAFKLEFFKPFAATNSAGFTFKGEGAQTLVTWTMTGEKNLITKALGLLMNMDKMIGGDFEKGLTDLKALVEAPPKAP